MRKLVAILFAIMAVASLATTDGDVSKEDMVDTLFENLEEDAILHGFLRGLQVSITVDLVPQMSFILSLTTFTLLLVYTRTITLLRSDISVGIMSVGMPYTSTFLQLAMAPS